MSSSVPVSPWIVDHVRNAVMQRDLARRESDELRAAFKEWSKQDD